MKIAVEKINNEALEVNEEIPAHLWDMDSRDIKFVDNIHIDCKFKNLYQEIIVDADITTHRKITCSRCLSQVKQTTKQEFKRSYNKDSLGEYLDIDNDIREEIILNFPMKVLCCLDCKGLCPRCGENVNLRKCNCKIDKF